ncbi:MAG: 50S ribosomal protein L18Ae [Acidilobus sp.]
MEREIKVFKVVGEMMLSHDSFPEWRKFTIYIRALKSSDAIEKVLSELGSHHKLKRRHVRITSISEVSPEEVEDLRIKALSQSVRVM